MSKKSNVISQNRKAFHDYFVEENYEAGIVLVGTEVKSIRSGGVNLKDSYGVFKNGELYIINMHISPYEKGIYLIEIRFVIESYYFIKRSFRSFL